jgi:hypothetical protein
MDDVTTSAARPAAAPAADTATASGSESALAATSTPVLAVTDDKDQADEFIRNDMRLRMSCDGCQASLIDDRYRCKECQSYHLCRSCYPHRADHTTPTL